MWLTVYLDARPLADMVRCMYMLNYKTGDVFVFVCVHRAECAPDDSVFIGP